jgi:hypothetical protein
MSGSKLQGGTLKTSFSQKITRRNSQNFIFPKFLSLWHPSTKRIPPPRFSKLPIEKPNRNFGECMSMPLE